MCRRGWRCANRRAALALAALSEPVASAPGNARHVLVLAADAVLLQTIHLPVAAARNLSAVVGYELDRYTPFEADRLYFVARQERRTPTQLQA